MRGFSSFVHGFMICQILGRQYWPEGQFFWGAIGVENEDDVAQSGVERRRGLG